MDDKILVTYASRTGTTASIAEYIAKTLMMNGLSVALLPMEEVKDLSSYCAVVAGSAVRKSKWLPEAEQFIQTHRAELMKKPFAIFSVCITMAMGNDEKFRTAVRGWTSSIREQVRPVSEGIFAGMLDFKKLPRGLDSLLLRLAVALRIFPKGDRRDWEAVRVWAEELPALLK